jgi:hypothetical protein
LGARDGGAGHRRWFPAAARGSGSPDFAKSGTPVVKSGGAWVCRDQRDTRDAPGTLASLGGARGRGCDSGGGSVRRRSPVCGIPALGTGQSLRHLAQKDQGDVLKLTEGLVRAGWPCRGVGDIDWRWRGGGACGEGSDARRLRASDHHGSTRGVPAEMLRGSRRLGSYRQ